MSQAMLRLTQVRNTVVNIQEMKEYCLYKQILPKRYIRERLLDILEKVIKRRLGRLAKGLMVTVHI